MSRDENAMMQLTGNWRGSIIRAATSAWLSTRQVWLAIIRS